MKKQWVIGVIIAGVIVAIFVIFNYQGNQDKSLSDVFPEESAKVPETEYEYVTDAPAKAQEAVKAPVKAAVLSPAAPAKMPVAAPAVSAVAAVPAAPAAVSVAATSGKYSIQVQSSKDKVAADKALEKIKAKGHAAFLVTKDLGDKGIWYRINVGPFASKQEAETYLTSLKADYKDGFVVYTK